MWRGSFNSIYIAGRSIQNSTHCSVEDALATLDLYKLVQEEWEAKLSRKIANRRQTNNIEELPIKNSEKTYHDSDSSKTELSFLDDRYWLDIENEDKSDD